MKLFIRTLAATCAAGLLVGGLAVASDHADSPALGEGDDALDAGADINDLYAFASPADPTKTVGILTVGGVGAATGAFSDAVSYSVIYAPVIGTDLVADVPAIPVSCAFAGDPQGYNCWIGEAGGGGPAVQGLVNGDTVSSEGDVLKVWAGLADDPFFFDLVGFGATVAAFEASFTGADALAGANTLAIVFEVTAAAVNSTTLDDDEDNDTTVLGAFGLTKRLPAGGDDGGGDAGDM